MGFNRLSIADMWSNIKIEFYVSPAYLGRLGIFKPGHVLYLNRAASSVIPEFRLPPPSSRQVSQWLQCPLLT